MSVEAIEAFDAAERWLLSLIRPDGGRWSVLGQPWAERVRRHQGRQRETLEFLEFIGGPHRGLNSVVVVGTSGKGTVTAMIVELLRAQGFTVADHTSPYLQLPTEKMRRDGVPIGPSEFASCVEELRGHADRWEAIGRELRYGQAWAALVMLWMRRSGCDFAVYEASVGGRFSNAALLNPDVAVITNVGLDHRETLGPDLAQIAWHKAGIAAYSQHVVTGETDSATLSLIQQEAAIRGATVNAVVTPPAGTIQSPTPSYQRLNAALALAAVQALGRLHSFDTHALSLAAALEAPPLAGRFEVVSTAPRVILDGAHNADKVSALVERFQLEHPKVRATILFGSLGNKSPRAMIEKLSAISAGFIATAPRVVGKEPMPAAAMQVLIEEAGMGPCECAERPLDGLRAWLESARPSETLLVTGSLYLIGEVRSHWQSRNDLLSDDVSTPSLHN